MQHWFHISRTRTSQHWPCDSSTRTCSSDLIFHEQELHDLVIHRQGHAALTLFHEKKKHDTDLVIHGQGHGALTLFHGEKQQHWPHNSWTKTTQHWPYKSWTRTCGTDLIFDGPGPIVHIIAISQHVHHTVVPLQLNLVLFLGLSNPTVSCTWLKRWEF